MTNILQIAMFFDLPHESLVEWKNNKIWEMSEILTIIAGDIYEIVDTANMAFSLAETSLTIGTGISAVKK